jgi:hypothetical protein
MNTRDVGKPYRHGEPCPPCPRCKKAQHVEFSLNTGRLTYYRCRACEHVWAVRIDLTVDDEDDLDQSD